MDDRPGDAGRHHQLPHAQHARRGGADACSTDLRISTQEYSWIVGTFQIAIMLQPICGYVLDVLGLKRGLAIFATAWSLISMAHGLAHNWPMLAVLRGCWDSPRARPTRRA